MSRGTLNAESRNSESKIRPLVTALWRPGRPPVQSLTLDLAVALIAAAKTVPVVELRPGLKDLRRSADLMHA